MGSGIVLLDGTVVNVALPTIQRALGGGLAAQQWVVNGYLLTLSSLILIGGSLGDLFGERRVFALGVSGFGAASLACALSPTIGVLVAMRALQGVAGALLVPSSLAVIVNTFPKDERGAAIGSWTAWGAIAGVLGPLAGGELLAIGSWRWLFVINIPLAAACVALILFVVPRAEPRRAGARKVDVPGALLCAAGLAGPVFALIEQPRLGWSSPEVVVPLLAGVFLLGAFLWQESRAPDPMLPLGLFKRRNFSAGNIETFSMYAGLAVLFFFLILFLQQIGGYTPLQSGLATLPVTVIMFVLSRRFGALADRFGPRFFMGAGPLVAACGLLLFQRIGAERRLRLRSAPRTARVRARPLDDRRAADRGGARRRGHHPGGYRLGRQQRDRAGRRPARHRRRRRGRRGLLRLLARRTPVGRQAGPGRARRGRRSQAPPARAP